MPLTVHFRETILQLRPLVVMGSVGKVKSGWEVIG